jgi:DNA-binding transcriptional MocR family regulator
VETIPFASDEPSADLLPLEELADCAATVLARDGKTILSYGSGAGYSPLRELIAEWFGVHPFRVVLTNGWLQGLSLISGELMPMRSAAVEYPADDRVLRTLLAQGGSLVYLAGDRNGLIAADLEQQLIQYLRPALIFVTPSFANPTGRTMPLERRRQLFEVLAVYNRLGVEHMYLLEDDSLTLTRFEGERLPALFDLSPTQTLYSSSFSASIAPGLRVGWLILPDDLSRRITDRANSTYITPALLGQATAYEFLARGGLDPHLGRLRETLKARRDAMLAALAQHLPEAVAWRPEGGYFVWLELPGQIDGRAVLARAEGVTAVAGTEFGTTSAFLRLSYAAVPAGDIPEGIERIAAAVRAQLEEPSIHPFGR